MERFKALSKFCPVQNNWILMTNYNSVINHTGKTVQKLDAKGDLQLCSLSEPSDLVHIFFNYMSTDRQMVALVLTKAGEKVLINNQMEVDEEKVVDSEEPDKQDENTGEIIKVSIKPPMPKIKGISSVLTVIDDPSQLLDRQIVSKKLQKATGLSDWQNKGSLKTQALELDYSSFFGHTKLKTLLPLVYQWIKNSGDTLDFSYHYYINEHQLSKLPEMDNIRRAKFSQNCQILDFSWLKTFPNLIELEFDQCQQIDLKSLERICKACPRLQSLTLKYCLGLNVRAFLEILKSPNLSKLVIDFPNFYCQVSAKEVMVSREEWRSVHSFSLKSLFMNSENLTLDVLDYLLKSCSELRDLYLNENILRMVAKNACFDQTDINEENVVNFHSSVYF